MIGTAVLNPGCFCVVDQAFVYVAGVFLTIGVVRVANEAQRRCYDYIPMSVNINVRC